MKEKHIAIALFALILISRLIFLSSDLGLDPDSYRFAMNADKIVHEWHYYYSRSPGNPLYEIINAPLLVYGGGWLTNLGTILAGMAGLLAFYLILKYYRFRQRLLLVGLFAFMPVSWINSFVTMDYWWSLALNLWAFYAALNKRYATAAILTGVSFGFRVPAGFFIFPIMLLAWNQERKLTKALEVLAIFMLTALVSFSPMLLTYGLNQFDYSPFEHPFIIGAYRAMRFITGLPALILLAVAVVVSLVEYFRKQKRVDFSQWVQAGPWILWLLLMAGMFWKNPADPGYLLPAIPFALLLLGSFLKPVWWIPLIALIILNNFISFATVDTDFYKRDSRVAINVVSSGVLVHHLEESAKYNRELRNLQALSFGTSSDGSQPLVLVSAFWPRLRYNLRDKISDQQELGVSPYRSSIIKIGDRWYGREISRADLEKLKSEKFQIYYTLDADFATRTLFRYRLADAGARALAL